MMSLAGLFQFTHVMLHGILLKFQMFVHLEILMGRTNVLNLTFLVC